jgi:hypothetical protein
MKILKKKLIFDIILTFSMHSIGIPSAIEIINCFDETLDLMSFRTVGTTGGFTAKITISELLTTSLLW